MGSDLVCDDAVLDVFFVGQAQVFLGRDITQHGCAIPPDLCRTYATGDVVVTGRNVGG